MLQLVLGTAGTGKAGFVLARMRRAAAGKKSVLLVPEQFSSSAESMVYAALGDSLGAHAEVYSFKKLCREGAENARRRGDGHHRTRRAPWPCAAPWTPGRRSAALPQAPPRRAVLQPVCAGH